ncbi:bifunctional diaminohydroxyphosphoribosylaminopyrimidine deaminase/5-amino-6-(5-phosphoribosylamino)uracil reductase RibD [Nocardioides sp.]|uniref:bifunctional diaminohydroxyphosphoribosylaminopyrimidine deaminase/5-amino-6-(5-phosphoribosylamino)uracil reductase RibD n=1 Tax=Nocardioides sp. TaxID=35761 RepID=UPI002CE02825|nr:bifunctional diaminohydroxyphosphoribosylaminopyrimidine deaminase/5-amino-6-(5-phosphoribosylamino)uracil reductase RibD [Nocardioides sp.]HSX67814.1 bifunctional diaminohydroxyphosphoribosylaminopyrimidine deaminase/5-amino-6-(5-phosphoribosylamino)uracil reductase RibD [Nocardioides sp.]
MAFTAAEHDAMLRALELAATPGVPLGPNPRVGCVVLAPDGTTLVEGFHRGAGTAHAEAAAIAAAQERGIDLAGATAVVTLEPCNHTGRTGPCAQALIGAGVARVVFAQSDPNPEAAGGAETLRDAGIEVEHGLMEAQSHALNRVWSFALAHQRPFVTWKFATSLDGRSAAADGTSKWITSRAARIDTHRLRGLADTMLVGTNTVELDDPQLTVRDASDEPLAEQPLRAVMGLRDLPARSRVFDGSAGTMHLRTHDPAEALAQLFAKERRHVFLEGGPTLAAAFWKAGLVDEVVTYVAPVLLGAGRNAVDDLGIHTISDAAHLRVTDVAVIEADGEDTCVRLTLTTLGTPLRGLATHEED